MTEYNPSAAAVTYVEGARADGLLCCIGASDLYQAYDAALATVAAEQSSLTSKAQAWDKIASHPVFVRCLSEASGKGSLVDAMIRRLNALASTPVNPVPAATEPVRLTDPDDPRIKPGARIRSIGEYVVNNDSWTASQARIRQTMALGDQPAIYLLAEAPDPDADLVAALPIDLATGWDKGAWIDVLDKVRAAGYDITRRADS